MGGWALTAASRLGILRDEASGAGPQSSLDSRLEADPEPRRPAASWSRPCYLRPAEVSGCGRPAGGGRWPGCCRCCGLSSSVSTWPETRRLASPSDMPSRQESLKGDWDQGTKIHAGPTWVRSRSTSSSSGVTSSFASVSMAKNQHPVSPSLQALDSVEGEAGGALHS